MKVIDLLNKIANGEEVPKKIKFRDFIFVAKGNGLEDFVDYVCEDVDYCFSHYLDVRTLNDEVEIIEDLDLILSLETEEKDEEIERLNNIINKATEYIERIQEEWTSKAVPERNLYMFETYLNGIDKLIDLKEILKGDKE